MHETIQLYLDILYKHSVKTTKILDLNELLQNKIVNTYKSEAMKVGGNFLQPYELSEIYQDGCKILSWFVDHRNKFFKKSGWKLFSIEEELFIPIDKNLIFKGYIDIVLHNTKTDEYKIIDLKTSYRGWKDNKKKDIFTRAQLGLYKYYFAKKHNVAISNITTEFIILKRKVWENSDFPQPRVSKFEPPTGTASINKYVKLVNDFINVGFNDDGTHNIERKYPIAKYVKSCKYCAFKDPGENQCPKWKK